MDRPPLRKAAKDATEATQQMSQLKATSRSEDFVNAGKKRSIPQDDEEDDPIQCSSDAELVPASSKAGRAASKAPPARSARTRAPAAPRAAPIAAASERVSAPKRSSRLAETKAASAPSALVAEPPAKRSRRAQDAPAAVAPVSASVAAAPSPSSSSAVAVAARLDKGKGRVVDELEPEQRDATPAPAPASRSVPSDRISARENMWVQQVRYQLGTAAHGADGISLSQVQLLRLVLGQYHHLMLETGAGNPQLLEKIKAVPSRLGQDFDFDGKTLFELCETARMGYVIQALPEQGQPLRTPAKISPDADEISCIAGRVHAPLQSPQQRTEPAQGPSTDPRQQLEPIQHDSGIGRSS